MGSTKAYAALSQTTDLVPFSLERRKLTPHDIHIEILYCGICHSDFHMARNDWGDSLYPMVPGHEIVGRVKGVGSEVQSFALGDLVMVGCMVGSCQTCPSCHKGLEQYCEKGFTLTYNSPEPQTQGQITYGGYSTEIVVDETFVLRVPKKFNESQLASLAPLVCAGITTYSPLRHWKVAKGMKVGVVGLGGLGHMALKLARAMGAEVILFTTSSNKVEDGKKLGANQVVLSKDPSQMKQFSGSLDFILNTVAFPHNLDLYLELLKRDGTLCLVGLPKEPHPTPSAKNLIFKRRALAGSLIGGIRETQEMLDFCAEHNITADIELIPIQKINDAYKRMIKNDVKYRFVIDTSSLK